MRSWHAMWVARTDEAVAAAEQREWERRQGERVRLPAPDWVMEHGIGVGAPAMEIHVGGRSAAGKRLKVISREEARGALADGVRACTRCRPDTELGML
ncbi:DUF6233 domain-containing protein [Streptomyces sp. NBC_00654]|uniref:DUF6233 domain-containing protein n=1 Tax=Streptomyces sp. NBC_00654 TaxID=2975799 RepID=UPI00225B0097|nr:DUF6233 domain-containing protein [Streptomyces sp. NBC_00654]MCX4967127.1 DUF6233 domain-containing protein [Streptomyces sp. NBC_00654]